MSQIDGGLRGLFRHNLRRGWHWQSIETGGTGRGVPDSNFCRTPSGSAVAVERWVEFKQTTAWAVTLSPEQASWHTVRQKRGGISFVAVRRQHDGGPRKGVAQDQLWLCAGIAARELKRDGLRCGVGILGCWDGGPSQWDWEQIGEILCQ